MCQITILIFEPVLQNDNLLTNVVLQSKLAQEILKDPYNFDFLTMREDYDERDLEDELTKHITQLLLELGKVFSFCGRQVELVVSGTSYRIDILFYHICLKCYVVV